MPRSQLIVMGDMNDDLDGRKHEVLERANIQKQVKKSYEFNPGGRREDKEWGHCSIRQVEPFDQIHFETVAFSGRLEKGCCDHNEVFIAIIDSADGKANTEGSPVRMGVVDLIERLQ